MKNKKDLHKQTSEKLKCSRELAKAVNGSVIYGHNAKTLRSMLHSMDNIEFNTKKS